MKKLTTLSGKLLILGSLMALSLIPANAANRYWKGGAGNTRVSTAGNWANNADGSGTNTAPGTGDVAVFTATSLGAGSNVTAQLNGSATWAELLVLGTGVHTGTTLIDSSSSAGHTLTLGTANTSATIITVASGAGAVTIGNATNDVNIATASTNTAITDTINNSSANTLTIVNNLSAAGTGTTTIAVTGTGTTAFNGAITNGGSGGLAFSVASGATANLAGSDSYTQATTVTGTLNLNSGGNISASPITSTGTFTEAGTGVITGTSSLTVNGGTTTLGGGTNSYTGATTVGSSGTLNLTAGTISKSAIAVAGTLTESGSGTISSTSSLTVNGGTVTLVNNNQFSGATVINGGTVNANATNALGKTSGITIENGGTLAFGANVNNAMPNGFLNQLTVTMAGTGGTIVMNGGTEAIGTLTLAAGTVTTIELEGTGSSLTLYNINFDGGKLVIDGWQGTSTGGTNAQILPTNVVFVASGEDDWKNHEADISWTNTTFNGVTGNYPGATYGSGQGLPSGVPVTAAPEPSTIFIGLLLLALLTWSGRAQLLEAGRKLTLVRA